MAPTSPNSIAARCGVVAGLAGVADCATAGFAGVAGAQTVAEAGYPGLTADGFNGFFGGGATTDRGISCIIANLPADRPVGQAPLGGVIKVN